MTIRALLLWHFGHRAQQAHWRIAHKNSNAASNPTNLALALQVFEAHMVMTRSKTSQRIWWQYVIPAQLLNLSVDLHSQSMQTAKISGLRTIRKTSIQPWIQLGILPPANLAGFKYCILSTEYLSPPQFLAGHGSYDTIHSTLPCSTLNSQGARPHGHQNSRAH